jgi:hypothetical protein
MSMRNKRSTIYITKLTDDENIIDLTSNDSDEVVEIPMPENSAKVDRRFSAEKNLVRQTGKAEYLADISLASKPRRVVDRGGKIDNNKKKKSRPVVMLHRLPMNKETIATVADEDETLVVDVEEEAKSSNVVEKRKTLLYCQSCDYTVVGDRDLMKLHLRKAHTFFSIVSRSDAKACTHCSKIYYTEKELIEHYRLMHVNGKKETAIEKATTSTVAADDATKEAEEVVVRIEVSTARSLRVATIDAVEIVVEARETATAEQNNVSSVVTYDEFKRSRTEVAVDCRYCIDGPQPYATKQPFHLDAHTKKKHGRLYAFDPVSNTFVPLARK